MLSILILIGTTVSICSGGFEVQYQDNPPTRVFAAISYNSNQQVYGAQTYDNSSSYICQFAG